jgi:hypothetical protein
MRYIVRYNDEAALLTAYRNGRKLKTHAELPWPRHTTPAHTALALTRWMRSSGHTVEYKGEA